MQIQVSDLAYDKDEKLKVSWTNRSLNNVICHGKEKIPKYIRGLMYSLNPQIIIFSLHL